MSHTPLPPEPSPLPPLSSRAAVIDAFDSLDVIGNGSFGIIRKVQRKSDGMLFARKELNFERMSERDKKQIVAEVNILKELKHEHIVRYHDRFVDLEEGMLYLVMEYCGGGDLGGLIKNARKHKRVIPEDTVWHFFYQIVLALHYCHTPHLKPGSPTEVLPSAVKRAPILHRDLKPENVFLDENNFVKLGDFGLSKQLSSAFTNTYVGTPYYMSPELIQERDYDAKSDIWSLGCLIYELCALNPPFHEAKTHSELANFIRAGSIPSLPSVYSNSLASAVKAMLNLNPAKRPSAAQLLCHERMQLAIKSADTQRMIDQLAILRTTLQTRQDALQAREQELAQREEQFLQRKEAEIAARITVREEEITQIVLAREEDLRSEMIAKEQATMQAVALREMELKQMWDAREKELRAEVEKRDAEILRREERLKAEAGRLNALRRELDTQRKDLGMSAGSTHSTSSTTHSITSQSTKSTRSTKSSNRSSNRSSKSHSRGSSSIASSITTEDEMTDDATPVRHNTPTHHSRHNSVGRPPIPNFETPVPQRRSEDFGSAMKGVILGNGEILPTPGTDQLQRLLADSPAERVDLLRAAFKKAPPPVPLFDAEPFPQFDKLSTVLDKENEEPPSSSPLMALPSRPLPADGARRPRRPSSVMRLRTGTAPPTSFATWQNSPSDSRSPLTSIQTGEDAPDYPRAPSVPPTWDLNDEAGLPSPFLRRVERINLNGTTAPPPMKLLTQVKSQVSLRPTAEGSSAGSSGGTGAGATSTRTSIGKSGKRRASSVRLNQASLETAQKKAFKP